MDLHSFDDAHNPWGAAVKLGLVSDIHGNHTALAQALALMGEVDEVLCLGDTISQYRFSNETVALLKDRGAQMILGNHEEVFFSRDGERARAAGWIDRELMDWLETQPHRRELTLAGREVLMVHSTPWASGGAYVTPLHKDFVRFGETAADIVLYGHIHQPVTQRVGGSLVVNPGSVGEGRYLGGGVELNCAVLDLASDEVRHISFAA